MKIARKFTNILFIIGFGLTALSGCQIEDEKVAGQELVENARITLSQMNSGVITVTNNLTNEVEQTLTFRYDEVGIFTYTLEGDGYTQFCNGYEIYTQENGEISKITKSDSDYQTYTADVRYPMTDEDYLYFASEKLGDVKSEGNVFTYFYEVSAITGEENLGKLEEFKTTFAFDDEGEFIYLDEISRYNQDGKITEYSYRIEIKQQNSVDSVRKPEVFENLK